MSSSMLANWHVGGRQSFTIRSSILPASFMSQKPWRSFGHLECSTCHVEATFELLDKGSHSRTELARSRRYAARILVLLSDYLWGKHHGIRLHSDPSSSAVRLVKGWNFRECSAIRSPFTSTMLRDIRSCGPIFMTSSFHTLKSPRLVRLPYGVIARRHACQNTSRSAPVIMTSAEALLRFE